MSASDKYGQRSSARGRETSDDILPLWRVRLYRRDSDTVMQLGSRALILPGVDARDAEEIALMGRDPRQWRAISAPFEPAAG